MIHYHVVTLCLDPINLWMLNTYHDCLFYSDSTVKVESGIISELETFHNMDIYASNYISFFLILSTLCRRKKLIVFSRGNIDAKSAQVDKSSLPPSPILIEGYTYYSVNLSLFCIQIFSSSIWNITEHAT